MAKVRMTVLKAGTYGTRHLVAGDPLEATRQHARIFDALGRATYVVPEEKPRPTPKPNEITTLRAEYERVTGKKAFNGWDADKLRAKIAAAKV